jgi:hypothetical protein
MLCCYKLSMKRDGYIVICIILLVSLGLAYAAPPSFHIFSGNVYCQDDPLIPLVTYAISATVDNGTDSFNADGSVSAEGEYFFIIDADTTYTIYFYIDGEEVGSSEYTMFGVTNDLDFTTTSETYCGEPPVCGDDIIELPEECEGDNLSEASCVTLGHDGGTLFCYPVGHAEECMFNESACTDNSGDDDNGGDDDNDDNDDEDAVCGDDLVEDPEDCEEGDLDGATCGSLGYSGGGNLACDTDCSFDTSGCIAGPEDVICGDGDAGEGEECDGTDLKGSDCVILGYDSGDLSCNDDCTFNENNCEVAGGGITFPVSPYGDVAFWSTISLFIVILGVLGYLFYDKFRKKPAKKIPKKLPKKLSNKLAKK